ncbi:hypothetical protein ABZ707_22490 [Streptomyces sp. NPDC006923]|uniref:hypothetical protein n=1 Tax=Streptomyces sp. NPDC006923 TaxID=3155355 RepID=UPI0033F0B32E
MSIARRPLLTATAAGTLLCALWFVPSANATDEQSGPGQPSAASAQSFTSGRPDSSQQLAFADTGRVDTTPYLFGGSALLGLGATFVAYWARRGTRAL